MATNEKILEEAHFYLDHDYSLDEASKKLEISRRTLQLHLKKLQEISLETFKLVEQKKKLNVEKGNKKGGSTGKRGPTWTEEEAQAIAEKMIALNLSYSEASEKLGIPKSTLHEMMTKGIKDFDTQTRLYAVSEGNRHGMTAELYQDLHNRTHPIATDVQREVSIERISGRKK